jgi:hypothetical protein
MTDTQQTERGRTVPRQRHTPVDLDGAGRRGRSAVVVALAAGVIGLGLGWAGSGLVNGGPQGEGTEQPGLADVEAARWEAQADHFEQLWGHRLYERAQQGDGDMAECLAAVREP